ncbi:MAG: hypothetical protein BLM47_01470 [Candidatus Reconcilbacillus cellulovorans]|uniref:Uncharacterized protein n=1 Tax=Candidatus Reconcilbacillus cellulovorans TaxID=1906605 RepID=A0A2A6E375_9BACL|nr:MAG: hypothetical protein BLM47_01470 [Candidatus Reconcilbacillus cellulovorans]
MAVFFAVKSGETSIRIDDVVDVEAMRKRIVSGVYSASDLARWQSVLYEELEHLRSELDALMKELKDRCSGVR